MKTNEDVLEGLGELAEFRYHLRLFLSFSEGAAGTVGITAQHYQLLQVVALAGEKGAPVGEIAQRMLLRPNSAVELVDRAQRSELVVRTADMVDGRRALVRLTAKGRTALGGLLREHLTYLQKAGPALLDSLGRVVGEGGR